MHVKKDHQQKAFTRNFPVQSFLQKVKCRFELNPSEKHMVVLGL